MGSTPSAAVPFEDFNALMSIEYDEAASNFCSHDYWRVTQAFRYYFDDPTLQTYVEVPVNYMSDGASVPRPFWDLLPPQGSYGQAAVLHDYLCEHLTQVKNGQTVTITRKQADVAFKDAMVALGVPRWKRNVMFIAVAVYAWVCNIKGVEIDSKKAAYLAEFPTATATLPDVAQP
jgi:hypothetical protein